MPVSTLSTLSRSPLKLKKSCLPGSRAALPGLDALVVADYQAVGVITPRVLEGLNDLAARYPQVVFSVDSRERIGQFLGMVRKPNDIEAARWLFPNRAPEMVGLEDLAEAGLHPSVDCGCPLVITMGEKGCLVLAAGGESPGSSRARSTASRHSWRWRHLPFGADPGPGGGSYCC